MAHAECALFGILNCAEVAAQTTYYGLYALQHRGQECAGIVSFDHDLDSTKKSIPVCHKGFGLVLDVFNNPTIFTKKLRGSASIGHTRYSTAGGSKSHLNIQPLLVQYKSGNLAVAHNGNISNWKILKEKYVQDGTIFQSSSDTELILHIMAQSKQKDQKDQLLEALSVLEGAFSLLLLTDTSMFAVRDPNGFRPLVLGCLEDKQKNERAYCVASETCALDLVGATFVREIEPGEVLQMTRQDCKADKKFSSYRLPGKYGITPCVFEYVYFSRPDSLVFGAMVEEVRKLCGVQLAHEHPVPAVDKKDLPVIVTAVPDSSNIAAIGYAYECQRLGYNCVYEVGIMRNHYVGRTFISPGQNARDIQVRCKFNPIKTKIKDRVVVLVDDSIVRGTTSQSLMKMLRNLGAKSVHFRVASPPVRSPCFYGMDFPSFDELLATRYEKVDAISKWLGTDTLGYLSMEGLLSAVKNAKSSPKEFCGACFTTKYPVPIPDLTASPRTTLTTTTTSSPEPITLEPSIAQTRSRTTSSPSVACFSIRPKTDRLRTPTVEVYYDSEETDFPQTPNTPTTPPKTTERKKRSTSSTNLSLHLTTDARSPRGKRQKRDGEEVMESSAENGGGGKNNGKEQHSE